MDKRDIEEQLKDLHFNMDEEIDDHNERRGQRSIAHRNARPTMDTSQAIVLAACIIVGGLWGGKLVYDYIQEQRLKAAINEAALYMQQAFRQADQSSKQIQADFRQRAAAEAKAREQRQAQQQTQRQVELARVQHEKRLQTPQCRFWWQQHEDNPTKRTASKKQEFCSQRR